MFRYLLAALWSVLISAVLRPRSYHYCGLSMVLTWLMARLFSAYHRVGAYIVLYVYGAYYQPTLWFSVYFFFYDDFFSNINEIGTQSKYVLKLFR